MSTSPSKTLMTNLGTIPPKSPWVTNEFIVFPYRASNEELLTGCSPQKVALKASACALFIYRQYEW